MPKVSAGLTGLLGLGIGILAPSLSTIDTQNLGKQFSIAREIVTVESLKQPVDTARKLYSSLQFQPEQQVLAQQAQAPLNVVPAIVEETIESYTCQPAAYTVRIVSYQPLIMHLENFFTPFERKHLLSTAENTYYSSNVILANGSVVPSTDRTSTSATLPREDPVADCIFNRVSEFQGYTPPSAVETLQITHYVKGQHYSPHYDWAYGTPQRTSDRVTTFFGILKAECDDCGTHFPRLAADWESQDSRWCKYVECKEPILTVKPVEGSALFWRNLNEDGTGDLETLHSGRLLTNGVKAGLNIWTREDVVDPVVLENGEAQMPDVKVGTGAPPVMHHQKATA